MRFVTLFRKNCAVVLAALAAMLLATAPAQAAKWFIDNALGDVKAEEKVTPATPAPVQILYEFQRDGTPHPKATKQTKQWVLDALKATGDFSEIVETPVANGAVLSIKFNNVVKKEELDQAKKDGFKAGLGFGLFGGVVATDHYFVNFEYLAANGAAPIKTEVHHALHMKFGKKEVEIPGTEVKNVTAAVQGVVNQAIARGTNTIVSDPAFPK
jgi:hypothetical protein